MKKYILLAITTLISMSMWADYVTHDNVTYYETNSTTHTVSIYQDASSETTLSGTVTIPGTFTENEVLYTVTGLDYWSYGNEVSLDLSQCTQMTSINLGNIYTNIATLKLPKEMATVNPYTGSNSWGQRVIAAFDVVADGTFSVEESVLFNSDKTKLVCYPERKDGVVYTVPATVTEIGNSAFYSNRVLEKIILPDELITIGNSAFYYCDHLMDVNIPSALKSIGGYAFYYCKLNPSNQTMVLSGGLNSIGENAFYYAFKNYNTTVEFPSTLGQSGSHVTVGSYAFYGRSVVIRAKMTDPSASDNYAFSDVSKIYVPQGKKQVYQDQIGWGNYSDLIVESATSDVDPGKETVDKPTIDEVISGTSMNLTFATTTEEATIRYRIYSGNDNSDPADWDVYDGLAKSIYDGQSVKVIALKSGWNNSAITQKTYDFSSITCKQPNINFNQTDTVISITTATEGALIYYTTDGSDPSKSNGTLYDKWFKATSNYVTYRAVAIKDGMFDSNISSSVNTNSFFKCPSVVIEQVVVGGAPKMKLSLSDEDIAKVNTEGMRIYYGVDNYWWDAYDWKNYGTAYTEPVYINSNRYIYAVAVKDGYEISDRRSLMMDYSSYTRCATPSIELDNENKKVTITTTEPKGKIYYTLDGSEPTTESTLYTGPFTSETLCTVRAITARDAETVDEVTTIYANSDIAERGLEDWFRLENVVFVPQYDSETGAYKMKMSHPEEGVTIMYYTDEDRWSENPAMANEYDGSVIAVDLNTYVHAYAKKEGKVDSYWSFMYINEDNYTVSRPSIQTNGETKTVTMSSSTPDAIIYYTLDGTDPASSETKKEYKESFAPGGNVTIKAVAVKAGMNNSSVEERSIYDWYYVSNIVMDFYVKDNELMCELSTENKEDGVTLYYSAGDWGSLTSTNNYTLNSVYTGPFKINRSLYVSCAAVKENYNTSVYTNNWVDMGSYTCNSPEITARSTDSTVVISCSTEGATIYYTSDGTDPIVDAKYKYVDGTELKLDHNCTFKAIAAKDKMFNSGISERRISDWFRCEDVSFEQFLDGKQPKMKLTSTLGSTIYYSFNDWRQDSVYREPFAVADGQYVYAIAVKEDFNSSDWREQYVSYSGYNMCTAPTIRGYSDTHTITISTNDGKGKIYYTLDGSNPTTADRLYTEAFTLTENCTIKAITVNDSLVNSSPAYYYADDWFRVERVSFIPSFVVDGDKTTYKVCLKTNTEDAVIYYSIGDRDYYNPENNALYADGDSIVLAQDQTVYAIAVRKGYNNSYWAEFTANLDGCTLSMYDWTTDQENKKVYFHASVDDAKFYYTIDGSEPTVESLAYDPEKGLDVKGNWEIKVMAAKVGMVNSESRTYRIDGWFRVSDVVVELYGEGDVVKAKLSTKDNEDGTKIYYYIGDWYSFDQNDLSNNSIWTGEPFKVTNGKYLQVMATKDAYSNSSLNQYWIDYENYRCNQPSIITNKEDSTVTFRCSTEGATIYYTTDESDPTTSNTRKSCSNNYQLKLTSNAMIKAYAVKDQYLNSSVNEAWVSNWYYVSNIVYTPYVEDNKLMMKLSTEKEENDVTIYYYQGGWSDFDTETLSNNIVYSGPFEVNSGKYISVMATKAGYNNSSFARESFNAGSYTCAQPSIISNQGDSTVTFRCSTEGALIYYTTDDSDPTISTTVKSAKSNTSMKLDKNCTIKAYAAKSGLMASNSNEITISSWFNVSKIVFDPYVEGDLLKMRLSTENNESDVTIYYKVDSNYDAFDSNNLSNNNVYDNTKPFVVSDGAYVHAMAVKAGYNNTSLDRIRYNYSSYTCSQPTITTNSVDTTATIRCSTTGAVVYYTLDGSNPATSTTRVKYANSAFKLTQNCTIKTIATKDDMMNSSASSLAYNSLKAATPEITLNGTTVTITSSTPNAVLYYAFGDDKTASEESNKYTGPFTLPDNRRISAIATRQGWNNSDSRNYYPSGVVKCPLVKKVSFDGHYMTLSTVEGATIYYRTDGQEPNTWNSSVYEGPIEINQVGTVKAKATHPYMTESDVATFEVEAYAGDTGATTKEAGGLETSMGWADLETITEFAISGPINTNDMSFIKSKMTSLEKLDLSDATPEGGIIPDNAFAGLPLVTFSSPNALKSVGKNIFSGCKELAAVIWNTTAKIPNDAFDDDVNPNLLIFVPAEDAAPNTSSVRNIIVNNTADHIYLSDGADNNFYSPKQFYTKNITYTHDFTLATGSSSGWETICLPFDCSYFVHESKGELKPFAEYNDLSDKGNYKPFWLRELTDIGYKDVKKIEAHKPYLISMPNNESYASRYRLNGKVTFSATNVYVPQTVQGHVEKGDITMYANFMNVSETSEMLLLNTEADADHEAGSIFVLNSGRAIRPFEAYVISRARSRAYISMSALGGGTDDDATAITEHTIDDSNMVKVYNLSGVLVKQSSKEDSLKGLAKGVYIVNGKRMIVK